MSSTEILHICYNRNRALGLGWLVQTSFADGSTKLLGLPTLACLQLKPGPTQLNPRSDFMTVRVEDDPPVIVRDSLSCSICIAKAIASGEQSFTMTGGLSSEQSHEIVKINLN